MQLYQLYNSACCLAMRGKTTCEKREGKGGRGSNVQSTTIYAPLPAATSIHV